MRAYIERVRKEHMPSERYSVRREAEARARDLIQTKLGKLEKAANRDLSRTGAPSSRRWGQGLNQPQVNRLVNYLPITNKAIRELWDSRDADVFATYERLRKDRAPGGDMLASLLLYLREPSRFAVFIPSLDRGARSLGLLSSSNGLNYEAFNSAVQEWRDRFGVDPVEADVILTVSDPRRGTEIESERSTSPKRDAFEAILGQYLEAKPSQPFGSNAEIWTVFEQLEIEFRGLPVVSSVVTLSVKASPGSGNWANVPWVAIFDSRAARSIRDGVYCVYLFRQDMSGFYLTLNQGVEEPFRQHGRPEGKAVLATRASRSSAH